MVKTRMLIMATVHSMTAMNLALCQNLTNINSLILAGFLADGYYYYLHFSVQPLTREPELSPLCFTATHD